MKRQTQAAIVALCASLVLAMGAMADAPSDRLFLIADGSFENGPCGGGSGWDCWSDTSCPNWIVDPSQFLGVDAYDGEFVGQLGGRCGQELNSNSFCQDFYFNGTCGNIWITWKWLGVVEGGDPGSFTVTITPEGENGYEFHPIGETHDTGGVWEDAWIDMLIWGGNHTLCFEFAAGSDESTVLIDMVSSPISPTPVGRFALSAVKHLYRD